MKKKKSEDDAHTHPYQWTVKKKRKEKTHPKNTKWLNYSWNYKRGKINDITKAHRWARKKMYYMDGEKMYLKKKM